MRRQFRLQRQRLDSSLMRYGREMSIATAVPLAIAIFALFAILGLVIDIWTGGRLPPWIAVRYAALSGLVAVGYAFGLMRRNWWLFGAAIVLQVMLVTVFRGDAGPPGQLPNAAHLRVDGVGVILLLIVSYVSFLAFINGTTMSYLRAQTEIDLAHEIHQVLVPAIAARVGDCEFVGFSAASGEVGGDLVDVVPLDEGWFGYVADVSGHGVSSGVVMGMFKSALRMRLRQGGTLSTLLEDLNTVLHPLKSSAMFVTAACVRGRDGGTIEYAVAGHLPILRVRANGAVDEITTPQVPVGLFERYAFASASLELASGEGLALITDGLTEVFDASDRELGIEAVKGVLASSKVRPLREIADAIVAQSRAHGAQLDDQTLLLIRRQ